MAPHVTIADSRKSGLFDSHTRSKDEEVRSLNVRAEPLYGLFITAREGNILRDCVRPAVRDHDDDILRENVLQCDFEVVSNSHQPDRVLIHISLGNQSSVRPFKLARLSKASPRGTS